MVECLNTALRSDGTANQSWFHRIHHRRERGPPPLEAVGSEGQLAPDHRSAQATLRGIVIHGCLRVFQEHAKFLTMAHQGAQRRVPAIRLLKTCALSCRIVKQPVDLALETAVRHVEVLALLLQITPAIMMLMALPVQSDGRGQLPTRGSLGTGRT